MLTNQKYKSFKIRIDYYKVVYYEVYSMSLYVSAKE